MAADMKSIKLRLTTKNSAIRAENARIIAIANVNLPSR